MARQTGFVLDRIDFVRKVQVERSFDRCPGGVTLLAVVLKHSMDVRHVANFEDAILAATAFVPEPDEARDAQPERGPPRPTTKTVRAFVRFNFDPFRKLTARVLHRHS